MTENDAKKLILLDACSKAEKAAAAFFHSMQKLKKFNPALQHDLDDLEPYDAMVSRFERTSEVMINKLFRAVQYYETGAKEGTIRDCLNFMIKINIIDDAEDWMNMRELRNKITHDYLSNRINDFYSEIRRYKPVIENALKKAEKYLKDNK
ncbi:MAG: nucleotidyltransferase substrate binding protein [Oligoflexia bacterium]|nr:nucleotidyltransferase substrate binding protein [Oligoflexia bacterium]